MTCDDTLIEQVYMLQTIERTGHPDTSPDYIGGMDIMFTNDIIIRDCIAEGIHGQTGEGNAAIFLWQGHNNLTIERNIIIDCNKGIGIGLTYNPPQSISDGWHADGGAIRNNFILRSDGQGGNNISIELCGAKNLDVHNNTVYSPDPTYFRAISFWDNDTIPNTDLAFVNNLVRGGVFDIAGGDWSAGDVAAMGNIIDDDGTLVVPEWFVDALNGDLHLTDLATAAIDTAQTLSDVPEDIDRQLRPIGDSYDYGADEYVPEPASLAILVIGAAALLRRRRQ